MKWSRNTTHHGFSYVYINGTIKGEQFSVVNASTLRIYDVHPKDSGFYDCYEANGTRVIGYSLVARSMFCIALERKTLGSFSDVALSV